MFVNKLLTRSLKPINFFFKSGELWTLEFPPLFCFVNWFPKNVCHTFPGFLFHSIYTKERVSYEMKAHTCTQLNNSLLHNCNTCTFLRTKKTHFLEITLQKTTYDYARNTMFLTSLKNYRFATLHYKRQTNCTTNIITKFISKNVSIVLWGCLHNLFETCQHCNMQNFIITFVVQAGIVLHESVCEIPYGVIDLNLRFWWFTCHLFCSCFCTWCLRIRWCVVWFCRQVWQCLCTS